MAENAARVRKHACERELVIRLDAMRNAQGGGDGGEDDRAEGSLDDDTGFRLSSRGID